MIKKLTVKNNLHILLLIAALWLVTGCDIVPLHMREQPRYKPLEASQFWEDGMASRQLPANTISRGQWGQIKMDPVFYTGRVSEDEFVQTVPIDVNREVLLRGQEKYNIFCAPCHGQTGNGDGMIVQRGMRQPASFHEQRLRDQADGYFYDAISNGFGVMYSYSSRIQPEDRWAIVAYVRALQFSQNVPLDELPADEREQIEAQLP